MIANLLILLKVYLIKEFLSLIVMTVLMMVAFCVSIRNGNKNIFKLFSFFVFNQFYPKQGIKVTIVTEKLIMCGKVIKYFLSDRISCLNRKMLEY